MELEALEDIRRLKYRYFRTLDLKLWDEFGGTFTVDIVTTRLVEAVELRPPESVAVKVMASSGATAPRCTARWTHSLVATQSSGS